MNIWKKLHSDAYLLFGIIDIVAHLSLNVQCLICIVLMEMFMIGIEFAHNETGSIYDESHLAHFNFNSNSIWISTNFNHLHAHNTQFTPIQTERLR